MLEYFATEKLNSERGQSLIEVLIAVTVGVITILAAVTVMILTLRISSQDVTFQTAAFLGQRIVDDVVIAAEGNWRELETALIGVNYSVATTTEAGDFQLVDEEAAINIGDTAYRYFFRVSPVNRSANGDIVVSGGSDDPATKKIDAFIVWQFRGDTTTSTIATYVTRARNFHFSQTDWSGGPTDPTDPVFMRPEHRFLKASSSLEYADTGRLKVKNP